MRGLGLPAVSARRQAYFGISQDERPVEVLRFSLRELALPLTIHERLVRAVLRISPQQIPQLVAESLQSPSRYATRDYGREHDRAN